MSNENIVLKGKQQTWEFALYYPCRTCAYFHLWWETQKDEHKLRCMCGIGLQMFKSLGFVPKDRCKMWKKGVSKMGFTDFNEMSKSELKKELEELRANRRGVGRKKIRTTKTKKEEVYDEKTISKAEWI